MCSNLGVTKVMSMGRTDFRIHLNILAETDLQDIVPVVQTLQYNLM